MNRSDVIFSNLENSDFQQMFDKIQVLSGMKLPQDVLTNARLLEYFISKLKQSFPRITLQQAETAFEMFSNNYLQIEVKTKQLSIQTFSKIIRAYLVTLTKPKEMEATADISSDEQTRLSVKNAVIQFNNYKQRDWFLNGGGILYSRLKGWGLLEFMPEKLQQIEAKAQIRVTAERGRARNVFTSVIATPQANTDSVNEARMYESIKMLFDDMIEIDMGMEEILTEKVK